ncbi:hypothetical protein BDR05DRAFT_968230 [Suillus weaverae]|nr:hypothetical protein BDR05DRAFT_968230 [Suillus weaverae]
MSFKSVTATFRRQIPPRPPRTTCQKYSVVVEDWCSDCSLRRAVRHPTRHDPHNQRRPHAHLHPPIRPSHPPGATLDANQQVHIESLPPILILHLERSLYDASKGGVAKVGSEVNGTKYRLFGALYHHGLSASGGHYRTFDVLHPNPYP